MITPHISTQNPKTLILLRTVVLENDLSCTLQNMQCNAKIQKHYYSGGQGCFSFSSQGWIKAFADWLLSPRERSSSELHGIGQNIFAMKYFPVFFSNAQLAQKSATFEFSYQQLNIYMTYCTAVQLRYPVKECFQHLLNR